MKVKIKRQDTPESAPYYQTFDYAPSGRKTVSSIIDTINYADDMFDANGAPARRIRWECSCSQKMCGACAIVINGTPALACGTFIDTDKEKLLTLEPLSKFPVICDLTVDRSCIAEHQKDALVYLGKRKADGGDYENLYSAAKCLKCGLCLEVCPNYTTGIKFFGAAFAVEAYLTESQTADRKDEIKKQYGRHFASGCSQSLACMDICPIKIPTLAAISHLNKNK